MKDITINNITCNYKSNPIGLDSHPYFSWNYDGDFTNFKQKSYQIIVTDSDNSIVWDSSEINSDAYINIKYEGSPLQPRMRYFYSIIIKSTNDTIIKSRQAFFETGKKDEKWIGNWITAGKTRRPDQYTQAPYLRKTFHIDEPIKQARLYITGLGYFEAYINGVKTSDDLLSPSYTNYDQHVEYMIYDVTPLLSTGNNVIGTLLGNGWYNCFTRDIWNITEVSWRHIPKMIAELRIITESSKEIVIKSDTSWKSTDSPITFNSIRNGEYYDANLEISNWNTNSCDTSTWESTKIIRKPGGNIIAAELEPIRIDETFSPIKFWKTDKNSWIFDLGQNISGFVKLYAKGKKGDQITVIYNERLLDDGINLDRRSNAGFTKTGEFQTDKYTKNSDDLEIWSPHFVYHGFRYIELVGLSVQPDIDFVKGIQIHTDLKKRGALITSDKTINKILKLSHYSLVNNYHSLMTDDPHREKNSWTGDTALSAEQTMFNYITVLEFKKWLTDIVDAQKTSGCIPCVVPSTGWGYNWGNGPDWSSALTLIPFHIYEFYNDISVLETYYDAIKLHCDYMESMADEYLVNYGIGDWCAPFDGPAISVNMESFKAPTQLTDTSYFYNTADTIEKMATILNNQEDMKYYNNLKNNVKTAFRNRFFDKKNMEVKSNCQSATACMLYQGLANEDETEALVNLLIKQIHEKDDHIDFGILGNKYVMNTLGTSNHFDLAIKMITQKTYPGFGYIIEKGATSLWETWSGNASLNQQMFSDISASLYKYVGGIKPDYKKAGFKHIIMQPAVDCGINKSQCEFMSVRGKIVSNWENNNGQLKMEIIIPYNCSATLYIPCKYKSLFTQYEIIEKEHIMMIKLNEGRHIIN